ncbi:Predicted gene 1527 [Apodemus speciosus]|uniref:Predicted gene 1527 n=1 Tax=Apodemus speciosus TaxID=105296 RepID=A0ABQ0FWB4_APOSI
MGGIYQTLLNLNKKKFKIKCIIPLNNLWAGDNVEKVRKTETSPCKKLFLFWPDGNFLASFRSIEQKDRWYYFLRSPLCITATNIDMVNDIIEKTGKIINCYEIPHKILMAHLQNSFSRWNSKISTAFPILPGLFLKDLILDGEGQFILKPREAKDRSKNQEGNMDITQEATSQTPPEPIKKRVFRTVPPIDFLDRMLPSPILDMLSIIAERGQSSDQIFRFVPEKSHWSLRDKLYTKQDLNWNEESMLTVASVLKIILLRMLRANYLLLKQLIHVLLQIKMSTSNNLDTYSLSVRIAPHVLWDPTCLKSLFGCDLSKKLSPMICNMFEGCKERCVTMSDRDFISQISIIQIMIDNYDDVFGDEDHIICEHNQKRSDDIKMSGNTAEQGTMKQHQHRTFPNGNFLMTEKETT